MTKHTKKIVVLISGSGSNLQAIIDKLHNKTIDNVAIEITAVISNKKHAFGLERAKKASIQTIFVDAKKVNSREAFDQQLIKEINVLQTDLIVLAGFMRILTAAFVRRFSGKILNIHPSLLPKYTGLNTHQRVIDAKENEHGASVHFVTETLDSGPVVLQAKVPIYKEDTEQELAKRVLIQEHQIYPLAIQWFLFSRLKMQDDHAILDGNILSIYSHD
ncbi:MAG: phosphoribosylglycinamide formyltransferase [Psychromonas sp.]|nr:phosphoribosylglycinamide formyltransferase [Psychromonas sp.]